MYHVLTSAYPNQLYPLLMAGHRTTRCALIELHFHCMPDYAGDISGAGVVLDHAESSK